MDATPDSADVRLLEQAEELIASLSFGQAGLVGSRVAWLSHQPSDCRLAQVLACFGAQVVFCCPEMQQTAVPVSSDLKSFLSATRPELCLRSLHSANRFRLCDSLSDSDTFDVTFVQDLPADPSAALELVQQIAARLRVDGELELLTCSAAIRQAVLEQAPGLGLGLRQARAGRLSLIRCSGPLHEYPVEGRDASTTLAHCRARLEYAAEFVAGADVLEAGSGTGIGARLFLERGARRIVCVDRSPAALAQVPADSRLETHCWDLNHLPLPFADGSFDVIICLEVLEHIAAQGAALRDFHRLLRLGGRLIVSVPDRQLEAAWAQLNRFGNPFHLHTPDRQELLGQLAAFAEVRLAQQRDVTGSIVMEEDWPTACGGFDTQGLKGVTATPTVLLAVCTKAPVGHTQPATPRRSLQLYSDAAGQQLELYHYCRSQENEVRQRRWQAWQCDNRFHNYRVEEFARWMSWAIGAGAVLIDPGVVTPPDVPADSLLAGRPWPWSPRLRLQTFMEVPRLLPAQRRAPLYSVVFLAPRARVPWITRTWWHCRHAQHFWFLEADGWRRENAAAIWPRRAYRRLKRWLKKCLGRTSVGAVPAQG